jgi:hypothetical protein
MNLLLKKGREKSLKRRHPWIFSGAVERVNGEPALGDTVEVLDGAKKLLARAAYSPESQIRARVWTFDPAQSIDVDFSETGFGGAGYAKRLRRSTPPHCGSCTAVRRPAGPADRCRRGGGAVPRRRRRALARPDPGFVK